MLEGSSYYCVIFVSFYYFDLGEQVDWPILEMAFKNTLRDDEKIEDYLRSDLEEIMPELGILMSDDDDLHGSDEIAKDREASRELQEKLEASVKMLLGS